MFKNTQQTKSYGSNYPENYTTLSYYTQVSQQIVPTKFQESNNEVDDLIKYEGWKLQQTPCAPNERSQVLASKNRILYRCVPK